MQDRNSAVEARDAAQQEKLKLLRTNEVEQAGTDQKYNKEMSEMAKQLQNLQTELSQKELQLQVNYSRMS